MTIVGGLRNRLIRDSLINMITESLDALGWFDLDRQHSPISVNAEPVDNTEVVPPNTLAVADDEMSDEDLEMGSDLAEHRWSFYIDFYAEDTAIGIHVIEDIKAILQGRMPSIGRSGPRLSVKDYTDTGDHLFYVEIEDVQVHRAHNWPKPWLKAWYSCSFDLLDDYGNEDDS